MFSIIKLISNVEIMGSIIEENKNILVMDNPLQIIYKQKNELHPPVISLQRYIPFSGSTHLSFKQEHIMSKTAPLQSMIYYYSSSLKGIQEHVDPAIDQELAAASGEGELSAESKAKLAMIEKHITKATLN